MTYTKYNNDILHIVKYSNPPSSKKIFKIRHGYNFYNKTLLLNDEARTALRRVVYVRARRRICHGVRIEKTIWHGGGGDAGGTTVCRQIRINRLFIGTTDRTLSVVP